MSGFQLDGSEAQGGAQNYHLFFIYNTSEEVQFIKLPQHDAMPWYRMVDTSLESGIDFGDDGIILDPQEHYYVQSHSVVVLWGGKKR